MDKKKIEINRDFLEQIQKLDDDTLRSAVQSIAEAAGVSKRQAQRATADIENVKKRISNMSDAELKKAVDSAGEEKAAEIIEMIKKAEKHPHK